MKDAVIFLTACINPKGMGKTALQNPQERLKQYLAGIEFYLKSFSGKILVVENTYTDIRNEIAQIDKHNRVEYLTFSGNDYDKSLGKGYGEALILKYAFEHSMCLRNAKLVIKISGRHLIRNFRIILRCLDIFRRDKFDISSQINHKKRFVKSDMFIASPAFFISYFLPISDKINDEKGYYFEHALYDAIMSGIQNGMKFIRFPFLLFQGGLSGTNGKAFPRPSYKSQIRTFFYFLVDKK